MICGITGPAKLQKIRYTTYPPPSNGLLQDVLLDIKFDVESNTSIAEKTNLILTNINVTLYTGTHENIHNGLNIIELDIGFQHVQPSFSNVIGTWNNKGEVFNRIYTRPTGAFYGLILIK